MGEVFSKEMISDVKTEKEKRINHKRNWERTFYTIGKLTISKIGKKL
jgi:hypothetical protein